jgi:hypothetical protein
LNQQQQIGSAPIPPTLSQQIETAKSSLRTCGAACITPPIFAALLEAGELDGREHGNADQTAVKSWWRELVRNEEATRD